MRTVAADCPGEKGAPAGAEGAGLSARGLSPGIRPASGSSEKLAQAASSAIWRPSDWSCGTALAAAAAGGTADGGPLLRIPAGPRHVTSVEVEDGKVKLTRNRGADHGRGSFRLAARGPGADGELGDGLLESLSTPPDNRASPRCNEVQRGKRIDLGGPAQVHTPAQVDHPAETRGIRETSRPARCIRGGRSRRDPCPATSSSPTRLGKFRGNQANWEDPEGARLAPARRADGRPRLQAPLQPVGAGWSPAGRSGSQPQSPGEVALASDRRGRIPCPPR